MRFAIFDAICTRTCIFISLHWQPPVTPPSLHLSKHKPRVCLGIPMFTAWVKISLLGSRKIEFITWVNPSSEYSLLGSDS